MSNLPLVGQSELMCGLKRANSTGMPPYASLARHAFQVDTFLAGVTTQNVRAAIEPEVQLLSRALYHGFTTAAGRTTIGEEYTDIFPVILQIPPHGGESSVFVARLLNGWPRVAAVALRAVCPWLQARWVVIEAKSSVPKHTSSRCDVLVKYVFQLVSILRRSRGHNALRLLLQGTLYLGVAVKRCSSAISQLHILLFYLAGAYFLFSNRILGIRYVKRTPRHLSFPLFPLRIVGVLQVLRLLIIATKQLARAVAQRRVATSRSNVQFIEGVSLASASSIAAAEPVGDEAEGAAGDAPTCALCLSPRKQAACTSCGHVFCWRCIAEWLVKKPECPLCRSPCEINSLIPLRFYDSL